MIENPNGCDLSRLRHKAREGLWLLEHLYALEEQILVITHTFDGKHGAESLHFKNRAFDMLPPVKEGALIFTQAREMLGRDYDLLNEVDHWHLEYDPK